MYVWFTTLSVDKPHWIADQAPKNLSICDQESHAINSLPINMDKLFWIIPSVLAGRPGPDDESWDLSALCRAGIGAILSVNDGRLCDHRELAGLEIAYACYPLSDWVPPQPGDVEFCLEVLPRGYDFVQAQLAQGRRVLVHCSGGNDRTGLFLSYFLVRYAGLSANQAIQRVQAVRPTALSAEGWLAFTQQILLRVESWANC